jgi:hypothetical protein
MNLSQSLLSPKSSKIQNSQIIQFEYNEKERLISNLQKFSVFIEKFSK